MSNNATIDIKDYRQPMVTSVGVTLGFLIGFLGQWVTEDNFAFKDSGDVIAFSGCFMGVLFLLYAVFRVLSLMTDSSKALRYYKNTLLLYVFGVLCAFGGLIVSAFI